MTEQEFTRVNERLRQRQAAIRRAREQAAPVHISQILPAVMADIGHRRLRRELAKAEL